MSSAAVLKSWKGQIVEKKFPLQQWLGGSNYSSVFLTQRPASSEQKAAIKLVSVQGLNQQLQEAQLALWSQAAKLSHPNLLRLFENGRCQLGGAPYLFVVMEYAEEDLSQILPHRALSPEEAKQMLPPVADALSYLHQAGFVHSGLKPSNVRAVGDQLKLSTDTLRKIGEPALSVKSPYDAPESARSLIPVSDVWSLGVLLVTVLTQHEPRTQVSSNGTVVLSDTIPEPFLGLARRCLQINPQQRPTVAELLGRPVLPAPPIVSTPAKPPVRVMPAKTTPTIQAPALRPERKTTLRIIALITAVLLLVALIAFRKRATQKHEAQIPPTATQATPPTTSPTASPAVVVSPGPSPIANAPGAVLHQEQPEVSQTARNTIQGHVKINVQLYVDASGNVSDAKPIPPIPSQYFFKQARAAALHWKFTPPQRNGRPQPSQWQLHFQFGRSSTQVSQTPLR